MKIRLVFLITLAASVAAADTAQIAEGLFADGVRLMDEHQYAEACAKFSSSLEYLDGLGTRGKLADCWEKLGRVASAWTAWRDVAARAHRSGESAREKVANARAQALVKRLPYLTVVGPAQPVDGIAVTDDGVTLDAAALGTPLPVDPGAHAVKAAAPGREPFAISVTLGEGERREVKIPALAPAAPPPPPRPVVTAPPAPVPAAETSPEPSSGRRTRRLVGITAVAVGGAAIVAGGVVALLARSQWNSAFDGNPPHCDSSNSCDTVGYDETSSARSKATIAGILAGGGAAVAITGAILWWTASGDEPPAGTRAHLAPLAVPTGVGLALTGGF